MGGGGGGGKKGGGSSAGGDIQGIQNALQQQGQLFGGLGGWETQFLSTPYNLGNYAMDIATGGTGPQYTSYGNFGYGTEGVTPFGGGPFGAAGGGGGGGGAGGGTGGWGTAATGPGANPWLMGFEQQLANEQSAAQYGGQQLSDAQAAANLDYQYGVGEYKGANVEFARANQLARQFQRGGGLLPDQQALINAQVAAGKGQLNQTLASQGLGNSTMGATLGAEIGLQGAATGGQLIQGNQQLVNQAYGTANQAYGVANQGLEVANLAQGTAFSGQQQFFNELTSIGQQNLSTQAQFWNQAMQGYGTAGAALNNVLAPYGMQLSDYQLMGNLAEESARIQAGLAGQNAQAQASGMSGLFSGLSSLLGGGGGAAGTGGGLLQSGVLGGVSGSGALGGISSGIGSALGSAGGIGGVVTDVIGLIASFL